jgi:hypothetical protein
MPFSGLRLGRDGVSAQSRSTPLDGFSDGLSVTKVVVAFAEGITNWAGIRFTSWPRASN